MSAIPSTSSFIPNENCKSQWNRTSPTLQEQLDFEASVYSHKESLLQPVTYYYEESPFAPVHYTFDIVTKLPDTRSYARSSISSLNLDEAREKKTPFTILFYACRGRRRITRQSSSIAKSKSSLDL